MHTMHDARWLQWQTVAVSKPTGKNKCDLAVIVCPLMHLIVIFAIVTRENDNKLYTSKVCIDNLSTLNGMRDRPAG